jgi:hypothetical protein
VELSKIITILLFSHLETPQIIATRIVYKAWQVHGPEENEYCESRLDNEAKERWSVVLPKLEHIRKVVI